MSIPDTLIVQYFEVYTDEPRDRVAQYRSEHPALAKKRLAHAITARYHGDETATAEAAWFEETFSRRKVPEEVPTVAVPREVAVVELLTLSDPKLSRSDARRLVRQGAVQRDGAAIPTTAENDVARDLDGVVLQIGKRRWFKLKAS
jgi:tyrosyl-tRNA synthetase